MGYVLHNSLKSKDRDLLQAKFQEYATSLGSNGIKGLQIRFSGKVIPDASKYLVRYQSSSGKTLFLHIPSTMEIVGWTIKLEELDALLQRQSNQGEWHEIPGPDYGDDVEIYSHILANGDVLQIGKDTEDREEFLLQFAKSFSIVFLPVLLLAVIIGFILAGKLLAPIRWLSQTVASIRSGEVDARVKLKGNGDELDVLGSAFNQMQDQNAKLIQGMRETLDYVAHDLRTPIMRMQNASSTALHGLHLGKSGDFATVALESCQENSETILKMLNAIMDLSEVEAGTITLKNEPIVSDQFLFSILDIYKFMAEEKNVEIRVTSNEKFTFLADQSRLLQAIANLLDNAIKYSPEGGIVSISCTNSDHIVSFEISDHGPGIVESEKEKIWDRLYRGDASRSTRGLGLGLSVVKAIAKAHGGSISFRANTGQGSVFTFKLPFLC